MTERLCAFVDESGDLGRSAASSRHFTMAGVMVRASRLDEVDGWLRATRKSINRAAHHELHWNKIKYPEQRQTVADALGEQPWGRLTSVVVCKSRLAGTRRMTEDQSYLYTLRFLCERISWFAQSQNMLVDLTIAHKQRFKRKSLDEYEKRLRADVDCQIKWRHLDLSRAAISTPRRVEPLQVADVAASAIQGAFEPDRWDRCHPEYLSGFQQRMWRGANGGKLFTYGLKIHPLAGVADDHPWLRKN